MSVYVTIPVRAPVDALRDGIGINRRRRLFADSLEELHSFANQWRIPRHLFRKGPVPFYELTLELEERVVKRGAKSIGRSELDQLVKVYQDARMARKIERGVGCPYCSSVYSKVISTKRMEGMIVRYRRCLNATCGRNFQTVEK